MKALKRLNRMGQAIEELRPLLSTLRKEEYIKPDSEVGQTSKSPPDDSKREEATKKVPETKAAENADLLISEVTELLRKSTGRRSTGKSGERKMPNASILTGKERPQSHEDRSVTEPTIKDNEYKSDADRRRDFWFSLAKQKIRI